MNILKFLIFSILFLFCKNLNALEQNIPKVILREAKKVTRIFVEYVKEGNSLSFATAFPIDKDHFLTAGHFCDDVSKRIEKKELKGNIKIDYHDEFDEIKTLENVKIIKYINSLLQDLCLVFKQDHGLIPVKFAKVYDVKYGDKIYSSGIPKNIFFLIFPGYVMQPKYKDIRSKHSLTLKDKIFITSPVSYGASGGMILNKKGEVIGVISMFEPEFFHASFGINLLKIQEFLK